MIRTESTVLVSLALLACATASAQQATEVYIPIGESPGVSGSESVIGTITDVEYEHHRMTISAGGEDRSVTLTPQTRYYVVKASKEERNVTGSFEDCEVGRRIEAYTDGNGNAIWVKIAYP